MVTVGRGILEKLYSVFRLFMPLFSGYSGLDWLFLLFQRLAIPASTGYSSLYFWAIPASIGYSCLVNVWLFLPQLGIPPVFNV